MNVTDIARQITDSWGFKEEGILSYLSGPITKIAGNNHLAFHLAESHVKINYEKQTGYRVNLLNPADHDETRSRSELMAMDIITCVVVGMSNGIIFLLPGWEHSWGSCLEIAVGNEFGATILDALTFEPVPKAAKVLSVRDKEDNFSDYIQVLNHHYKVEVARRLGLVVTYTTQ